MSASEQEMLRLLGDKFTHYVGKEDQLIARTESARQNNKAPHQYMTEKQKKAAREKMQRLEELRKKHYLNGKYSFQRVMDIVCAVYEVTEEELLSARRFRKLVQARQQVIRIMRDKRGMSWFEIGRRLNRDHSTVLHCYGSVHPATLENAYEEITERIENY